MTIQKLPTWAALISICLWTAGRVEADGRIVGIYATGPDGTAMGTGFVMSSDGLVLTCYHVVAGAFAIDVYHQSRRVSVKVAKVAPAYDLAMLQIPDSSELAFLSLAGDEPTLKSGTPVRLLAFLPGIPNQTIPGNLTQTGLLDGRAIVGSDFEKVFERPFDIVPIKSVLYKGMSGSPVLVGDRVVGVYQGTFGEGGQYGWAIPRKYVSLMTAINADPKQVKWQDLGTSPYKHSWKGAVAHLNRDEKRVPPWLAELIRDGRAADEDGRNFDRVSRDCRFEITELQFIMDQMESSTIDRSLFEQYTAQKKKSDAAIQTLGRLARTYNQKLFRFHKRAEVVAWRLAKLDQLSDAGLSPRLQRNLMNRFSHAQERLGQYRKDKKEPLIWYKKASDKYDALMQKIEEGSGYERMKHPIGVLNHRGLDRLLEYLTLLGSSTVDVRDAVRLLSDLEQVLIYE